MRKIILLMLTIALMLPVSACTFDFGDGRLDFGGKIDLSVGNGSITSDEEEYNAKSGGIKKVIVENRAGNIDMISSDVKDVEISLVKKVKSDNEEAKKAILDNIETTVEQSGSRITIEAKTKDKGENPWDWARKKYGIYNLSIDFQIKVPSSVEEFEVRNNAGNIKLQDLKGYLYIQANAGDIDLENVSIKGDSSIKLNAGNVNYRGSIANECKFDISGNAGNVKVFLPLSQKFDIDANLTAGNIQGSFLEGIHHGHLTQAVNGGGARLTVKLNAGNIDINKD